MIKILNENKNNKKECFVELSAYDCPSLWSDQFDYDVLSDDYFSENIYMDFSNKTNFKEFFSQDLKTDASIIENVINDVLYDLEYDADDEFIDNIDDDEKLMETIKNSLQQFNHLLGDEKCTNQTANVIFDLYRDNYRNGDVDASEHYDEIISILEIKYNTKFEQYTCIGAVQGDYYPVIYDAQKLNKKQMDYVSDMLFGMFDLYEYKSSEDEFYLIFYNIL